MKVPNSMQSLFKLTPVKKPTVHVSQTLKAEKGVQAQTLSFRMPAEQIEELEALCELLGMKQSAVIRLAVSTLYKDHMRGR